MWNQEYWQDYTLFHSNLLFSNDISKVYLKLLDKLLSQLHIMKKLYLSLLYFSIFSNNQTCDWIYEILNEYRLELFLKQSKYIHKKDLIYCQLIESIIIYFHSFSNIIFFNDQKFFYLKINKIA